MATHVLNIPIPKIIDSPFQGRFFNAESLKNQRIKKQFEELKNSIEQSGLLQPVTVRAAGEQYELIDGHRRLEAYKQLGKGNIPALIKEVDDKQTQVLSVVANLQRSNLSNIERAAAFEKILAAGIFQNKKELSRAIGKDETYVGDLMNMLKMDERILNHVAQQNPNVDVRALRIIRKADKTDDKNTSDKQYKLYLEYVHKNLSRKQLQDIFKKMSQPQEQQVQQPTYKLKSTARGISLSLDGKMNKKQQQEAVKRIETLLNERMEELLQGL